MIKRTQENPDEICWVCNKPICTVFKMIKKQFRDITIAVTGKDKEGNKIVRHGDCHIGSHYWLRSEGAKQSRFYHLYKEEVEEANE